MAERIVVKGWANLAELIGEDATLKEIIRSGAAGGQVEARFVLDMSRGNITPETGDTPKTGGNPNGNQ